jgi:prepilin-type N-terminal cleavage/methylation domain-containing protein
MGSNRATGRRARGGTLIEVMVACVILSIIALGGAAYLYHARATDLAQRNKRVALEAVNSRLEDIRAAAYGDIKPQTQDYAVHYLKKAGSVWQHSSTNPAETATINGMPLPLTTTVQYMDIDGGGASYDYVHVKVAAGYRVGQPDTVTLETYVAP